LIYWSIVLHGAKFSIFLFDVEKPGFVWAFGWLNRPS
jgi:hypothetical protein